MRETTRHRKAFAAYLDMGARRTIERLRVVLATEEISVTTRTLYEWSRQFRWQMRIDDIEREARRVESEEQIEAIREMRERQSREALLLQQKGTEWIANIEHDAASPEAAIRAIVEGAKLERLARGEVTERTELRHSDTAEELRRMSDEQLDELIRSAQAGMGRKEPS
jgi:transposase-like protein